MAGAAGASPDQLDAAIRDAVASCWGYRELRPLQREAIEAGLARRDSLVVMPTGGGKSLCYQVPPLVAGRLDVVVSPLISLMKDQVDGLRACGYPAAAFHSHVTPLERRTILQELRRGGLRLLFVSPERLVSESFLELIGALDVRAFAIDEAHCISHWGHDFRPEYRRLAMLRDRFPGASLHAFTATATPRVRDDIARQLGLRDADVLVGVFDRPNLVYRVVPRTNPVAQVVEVVQRHRGEATIVYCISRAETERLAGALRSRGVAAEAYHAGMTAEARRRAQEAFAAETLDVVVATVAFGMGIDRSNVRCVVHAAMPQSVEHYQQETGRAGRDGLEAECVLLYSGSDVFRWRSIMERREDGEAGDQSATEARRELLWHMQNLCQGLVCRHRALSRYFGQDLPEQPCGACDVCLGEVAGMTDSTATAQKILSCVARTGQRFGIGHVVRVLRGSAEEQVARWGHDRLSTFGLLSAMPERTITNLVHQLVDQGVLARSGGDRPIVTLNERSIEVLRGERPVQLREPAPAKDPARRTRAAAEGWDGVDRGLFEHLRKLRRRLAAERAVPAYVIFGDATLRELARRRPTDLDAMAGIKGVGAKKLADLGAAFTEAIREYAG